MERIRKIVYYKKFFLDFFHQQSTKVKEKIDHVLFVVTVAERIPAKFFQHLEGTNGLYEIRVEFQGNIYRMFCCFDDGQLVVLFNGFQKKSQKTPSTQLERALKIMTEYFDEKQKLKKNDKKFKDKNITTFDEHLDTQYGKIGTAKRTEFEIKAKAFAIGEIIKEERRLASMTQEQLAEKTGTKKSFISRIENGHSDIQLSTLYKLLEYGLGRKVSLTIQ